MYYWKNGIRSNQFLCVFLFLLTFLNTSFSICAQQTEIQKIANWEKKLEVANENKNYSLALAYGDSILKTAPANYPVRNFCFQTSLFYQKDTIRAMNYLRNGITYHPFNKEFNINFGWFLLLKGSLDSALIYCKRAYNLDRSSLSASVNYAHSLFLIHKYNEATEMYNKAILLTTTKKEYEQNQLADYLLLGKLFPGSNFDSLSKVQENVFNKSQLLYEQPNNFATEYEFLNNNTGTTFDEIIKAIKKTINTEISISPLRHKRISKYLTTLGFTLYRNGQVNGSIDSYKKAILINEEIGDYEELGRIYYNMGVMYKSLRILDSSYYFYSGSAYYYSLSENYLNQVEAISGIAQIYDINNQTDTAFIIYKTQVLPTLIKYNASDMLVDVYSFFSTYYKDLAQLDSSNYFLEKSIEIVKRNSMDEGNLISIYNQLGSNAANQNDFVKAKEYLFKVQSLIPENEKNTLTGFQSEYEIGVLYFMEKNYDSARLYFNKAIGILLIIRETLNFNAKIKFLSANTKIFNYLALCCHYLKDYEGEFKAIEQSKSLVLLEKIGGNINNITTVKKLQEQMSADEIYYLTYFSNATGNVAKKIIMVIDKDSVQSKILIDSVFIATAIHKKYTPYLDTILLNFNRFWTNPTTRTDSTLRNKLLMVFAVYLKIELADAVSQKRGLDLGKDEEVKKHENNARALSSLFYDGFIKPFEKQFKNKNKITFLTDGHLSFVPFESMVDESGIYLTEKYSISYLPSLKVADEIKIRQSKNKYTDVVLIGNPVFKDVGDKDLKRGNRALYAVDGIKNWEELEGAKKEVLAIQKWFKNNTTLSENNCTEENVKKLFANKSKTFKIIHFATHGFVFDKNPQLSALVLNQVPDSLEDGYLSSREIEEMNIKSDLVVLSACETGSGKLIEGEGVQGLSSSFIVAGANSLIVSLWSVSDESTRIFMEEVYKLTINMKFSFKDAVQKIKGDFIKGKYGAEYKKPYYWAPFIYIGN